MVTPAVNRLSPEQRQREITAATRQLLREVGYERLKTSDVASRCGVSEGLIYRYFRTKDELLTRVCEGWFDELLALKPAVEEVQGTYDRLHYVVTYSLTVVRQEPALTRYVLNVLRSRSEYRASHLYELNRGFTGVVAQVLHDAVRAGDFRDDVSIRLLRDMIFGAVEHQTWSFLRGEGDFTVGEAADGITRVIYRGMAR